MGRFYEDVRAGLIEAISVAQGSADPSTYRIHVPPTVDVRAIRKRAGLTQERFAEAFGFSVSAVRDWEQRRRTPEGPVRAYLLVLDREPEAVRRALAG